jgi:hypothetical protein
MNEQNAITDVMTIGVPVTDQDRALEFYLDTLGFETRRDVPLEQFGKALDRGRAHRRDGHDRAGTSARGSTGRRRDRHPAKNP